MNLQNVFDTVAKHLLTQNARSEKKIYEAGVQVETLCCYRGENGLKCAIGALIKDEFYQPGLENQTPSSKQVFEALKASGVLEGDFTRARDRACRRPDAYRPFMVEGDTKLKSFVWFLQELQIIHDDNDPQDWPKRLDELAQAYRLQPYRP